MTRRKTAFERQLHDEVATELKANSGLTTPQEIEGVARRRLVALRGATRSITARIASLEEQKRQNLVDRHVVSRDVVLALATIAGDLQGRIDARQDLKAAVDKLSRDTFADKSEYVFERFRKPLPRNAVRFGFGFGPLEVASGVACALAASPLFGAAAAVAVYGFFRPSVRDVLNAFLPADEIIRKPAPSRKDLDKRLEGKPSGTRVLQIEDCMGSTVFIRTRLDAYCKGYHGEMMALAERFRVPLRLDTTSRINRYESSTALDSVSQELEVLCRASTNDVATALDKYVTAIGALWVSTELDAATVMQQALGLATSRRESLIAKEISTFQDDFDMLVTWLRTRFKRFDPTRDTIPIAEAALTWHFHHEIADSARWQQYLFGDPFDQLRDDAQWQKDFRYIAKNAGIGQPGAPEPTLEIVN